MSAVNKLIQNIHNALKIRMEANFHLGCSEDITLTMDREEIQEHLSRKKLYRTTMLVITEALTRKGYTVHYQHAGTEMVVIAHPRRLLTSFNSLEDLHYSPWLEMQ